MNHADQDQDLERLEAELRSTREHLQETIEELETSNEELRTANEEVLSMNEELTTVNAQMQEKLDEVNSLNDDLSNLISSTDIATIFLDTRLHVKRYTPTATRLMNLIPADVGRPIEDLTQKFDHADLATDAQSVLQDLHPVEREVQGQDGSWYTMRLLPYRTRELQVDGIVVTFADVTRLKSADEAATAAQHYAESVVETVRLPLLVLDKDLRVISANEAFYRLFGGGPADTVGRKLTDLGEGQWDAPPLSGLLARLVASAEPQNGVQVCFEVPQAGWRTLVVSGRRFVRPPDGSPVLLLLAVDDVTEQRKAQVALTESQAQLTTTNRVLVDKVSRLRALAGELAAAEDRERKRIGKILHDHVQQLLVASKLHLGVVRAGDLDESLRTSASLADALLDQSITASRTLTVELSPPVLHDAGLPAALAWLGRRMLKQHGLRVQLDLCEDAEPAEPLMKMFLFEAIRELLFNVVKHSGVLEARVAVERKGSRLIVRVEDEGRGFDTALLLEHRADDPTFGLFSIQQRVESLGGGLFVESVPGKGTRITLEGPSTSFVKPVAEGARVEGPAPTGGEPTPSGDAGSGPIRVLLADDHELVRQGLAMVLGMTQGIEVVGEATNGAEAVERARTLHPNVVVMDVTMPVLNGVDATRQIVSEDPGIRIIGLSMHEGGEMATAMRDAGAVDFVTKGGPSEALIAAIHAAFRMRSAI
jgi:two-component system CheB/CheR fusion protein